MSHCSKDGLITYVLSNLYSTIHLLGHLACSVCSFFLSNTCCWGCIQKRLIDKYRFIGLSSTEWRHCRTLYGCLPSKEGVYIPKSAVYFWTSLWHFLNNRSPAQSKKSGNNRAIKLRFACDQLQRSISSIHGVDGGS